MKKKHFFLFSFINTEHYLYALFYGHLTAVSIFYSIYIFDFPNIFCGIFKVSFKYERKRTHNYDYDQIPFQLFFSAAARQTNSG